MKTVFLDLETTGLNPEEDEIVEVGILGADGVPLVDSLVRPTQHESWPKAEALHGISPAAVQDAPPLVDLRPRIVEAVTGAQVVIYNAPFDSGFLVAELAPAAEIRCAMREFAEVYGEWSEEHQTWRWQRLHVAAAYVGFEWPGAAHRAIHDCAATRAVWRYLVDPAERSRVDALHPDKSG